MENDIVKQFLIESNAIEDVFDDDSFDQAMYAWKYLIKEPELTIDVVLKTHKILMLHQKLQPDQKGYFRQVQVWVGGRKGVDFREIRPMMGQWVQIANKVETEKEIKQNHIQYEKLHPFLDGNGRSGRLFMNWQRLLNGLPIQVIKAAERHKYYQWFE